MWAYLKQWNLLRVLRLGIGISFMVSAYADKQGLFYAILGGLFVFQAVTNTGCGFGSCATRTCSVPAQNTESAPVQFEEIK